MPNHGFINEFLPFALALPFRDRDWFYGWDSSIYIRHTQRSIGRCLDLASINIHPPGQGTLKALLAALEALPSPWTHIYIENVLALRLADFLYRSSWTCDHHTGPSWDYAPSFHKKILHPLALSPQTL